MPFVLVHIYRSNVEFRINNFHSWQKQFFLYEFEINLCMGPWYRFKVVVVVSVRVRIVSLLSSF